ncbi:MAG: VWA domain-containing protein, partial [Chloroflexi bacterium CFX6]|nr:VWA domain-containing protein [Chloroflexi bacterium CFX6]
MNPTPASSPTRSGRAKGLARIVLAAGTCAALAWHFAVPHPNRAAAQVGLSPTPTRAPTPTATAVAEPGLCSVVGEQRADAAQVEVKQPLGMRFHLRAVCPDDVRGRADILLLIDNSASMTEGGKWGAAKAAVLEFITRVDFDRNRVGLVPFNSSAYVAQPLTFNQDYLTRALAALPAPQNNTDIAAAITLADKELSLVGRREAVHILVVLTDGQSSAEAMHAAAGRARARGVVLFAIGLGADAAQDELRKLADSPSHYYFAPGPEALAEIYTRIASLIREVLVTDVVVVDRLGQAVAYVPESGRPRVPAALDGGRHPRWGVPFLTVDDTALTYAVRLQTGGRQSPSEAVFVDFADGDGVRRRVPVTPAAVDVVVPETRYAYLPQLWKNACVPSTRAADVVLALDSSSSMTGEKLAQAVYAGKRFVGLLDLRADRAAVVAFDADARVLQPLTRDRAALDRALDG